MSKEEENKEELNQSENENTNEESSKEAQTQEKCENEEEKTCEQKLEDMTNNYNTLNDKYLRAYADFENTKTRLTKDKYNAIDFAIEKFAKDLLEVVDTLDLAIKATENTQANDKDLLKNLVDGVDLTSKKLVKALEKHNVVKIQNEGEFNPEIHQVITEVEDSDKKSKEIIEVFQEGYKLNNRVLRASMVSVAK